MEVLHDVLCPLSSRCFEPLRGPHCDGAIWVCLLDHDLEELGVLLQPFPPLFRNGELKLFDPSPQARNTHDFPRVTH